MTISTSLLEHVQARQSTVHKVKRQVNPIALSVLQSKSQLQQTLNEFNSYKNKIEWLKREKDWEERKHKHFRTFLTKKVEVNDYKKKLKDLKLEYENNESINLSLLS